MDVNEGRRELCRHVQDFALKLQIAVENPPTATQPALPGWRWGDCDIWGFFFFVNEASCGEGVPA